VNSISPAAIPTGMFGKAFGVEADKADAAAGIVQAAFSKANPFRAPDLPTTLPRRRSS